MEDLQAALKLFILKVQKYRILKFDALLYQRHWIKFMTFHKALMLSRYEEIYSQGLTFVKDKAVAWLADCKIILKVQTGH